MPIITNVLFSITFYLLNTQNMVDMCILHLLVHAITECIRLPIRPCGVAWERVWKTTANTIIIATNEAGMALVILGNKTTMAMVSATKPAIIKNGVPVSHSD